MFYSLIRQLLFRLSPEASHHAALRSLAIGDSLGLLKLFYSTPSHPVHFMGIDFPNPVGLAAGLDKNGDYIDALAALGFGFIHKQVIHCRVYSVFLKPKPLLTVWVLII